MVWIDCFTIFVLLRRFFFSLTLIKPPYLKNCQGKCCGGCEVSQLLPYYQYIGLKFEQGFIVVFN